MMTMNVANSCIFEKTERGREEIATRKYGLGSRLRWLLVLIDGKTPKFELLQKVSVLGLDEKSLVELVNSDFIEQVESTPAAQHEKGASDAPVEKAVSQSAPDAQEPQTMATPEPSDLSYEKILAIKNFFNETIKSTIGLRGFSLQLKVERAGTLQEFRDLRDAYFEAVLKAKGKEMAHSLRDRLDQHLKLAENTPADKN